MTTGERLEGIVHKTRVQVSANISRHKCPSRIEILAVAAHNEVLDVVKIWLAASNTAWPRLAEEILHALGDEEGHNMGQGKASPAFFPLPELARDHGLSCKTTCGTIRKMMTAGINKAMTASKPTEICSSITG